MPFTCIPEIVARSILPRVSRALGIPVMSLILDEQTGLAGVLTRLEVFVDLLARRRMQLGNYQQRGYLGIDVGSVSTNLAVLRRRRRTD